MALSVVVKAWKLGPAALDRKSTSRMEGATFGLIRGIRYGSRDAVKRLASFASTGKGGKKPHRIRMAGFSKDRAGFTLLHNRSRIHHIDSIRDVSDHPEIVGDVKEGHLPRSFELLEEA
jgi:hypothetical protein